MPDKDFFGTDTFTYTATDGIDKTVETLVTIIVTPVNDPPIAADDVLSLNEDTPTELPILANDLDVDDQLTPAMVTVISNPAHGTIRSTTGVSLLLTIQWSRSLLIPITDQSGQVQSCECRHHGYPVNEAIARDDGLPRSKNKRLQ